MTKSTLQPDRVDEPQHAPEYADVLSRVATKHQPVIVRRGGVDFAAVVPLEHLELLQDILAQEEAERIAEKIDWDRLVKQSPPPQHYFDQDEPKPF